MSITATVENGNGSTSGFSIPLPLGTVPNTTPTVTPIADQFAPFGGTTGPIAFQIADAQWPASALAVTAVSSDPAFVPQSGVVLLGLDADRDVVVYPTSTPGPASSTTITSSPGMGSATTRWIGAAVTNNALTARTHAVRLII